MNEDFSKYNGKVQVKTTAYNFPTYLGLDRWNSYYHQIEETLAFKPKSVLIVGKGDNVVGAILSQQGVKITTFDFDETLYPDIIGNVIDIESLLEGKRFDVILCCQVLEHLPYENFEKVLKQFSIITDKVIISLPYASTCFKLDFKIPRITERRITLNIHNVHKVFKPNEEHYWEIGFRGYSKRRIKKDIETFFVIKKQFTAKYNHYHLFFILKSIHL